LKIFFSRTSRPNSIKLGSNYPWIKGIQVCTNKGPSPLQRGDNYKNVKMGSGHLKFFSRTTEPILTRLGTNHPWGGDSSFSNEGGHPSTSGDNSKRVKLHRISFLNLLYSHRAKCNQTFYKLSLGKGNSSLFNERARSSSKGR
jgi:hypothetical protein